MIAFIPMALVSTLVLGWLCNLLLTNFGPYESSSGFRTEILNPLLRNTAGAFFAGKIYIYCSFKFSPDKTKLYCDVSYYFLLLLLVVMVGLSIYTPIRFRDSNYFWQITYSMGFSIMGQFFAALGAHCQRKNLFDKFSITSGIVREVGGN